MDYLLEYFPDLSDTQRAQFEALDGLYRHWNEQINVISRKDIDNLYAHHILHSLAIAKVVTFKAGASILDLGTGGGFPGIPLAILFPEVAFTLTDGIGKKIKVVQAIVDALALQNVTALHARAEELKTQHDFVVTRAVATFDKLLAWTRYSLRREQQHGIPNGIFALKGGDIRAELKLLPFKAYAEIYPIQKIFPLDAFADKAVVYVQG